MKTRAEPGLFSDCLFLVIGAVLSFTARTAEQVYGIDASLIERGRAIYEEGRLISGTPLIGERFGPIEGAAAACATCHRRSGMGGLEGGITITPITGNSLFSDDSQPVVLMDPRTPRAITNTHPPYTDQSLAQALRNGVDASGASISELMPRYPLAETDMQALIAYLRQLSVSLSPGVSGNAIRFATAITPEVEPRRRQILIEMLRMGFTQRNLSNRTGAGRMRMGPGLLPRTRRDWELSVWELSGPPAAWAEQLANLNRANPVFALVSGVSESVWTPVDEFCRRERIPCLFPSIPLAPTAGLAPSGPLYFTAGVELEARVLAQWIRQAHNKRQPRRVVQIHAGDPVGSNAEKVLTGSIRGGGSKMQTIVWTGTGNTAELRQALRKLSSTDAVVFWLKPDVFKTLTRELPTPPSGTLYFSGQLIQQRLEVVPDAWKTTARIVYPYELGDRKRTNLLPLRRWLESRNLSLVDESLQAEIFFNATALSELITMMLDNLYRDYLVERAEDMLSQMTNVSPYPHLGLGVGQHFASKGAYLARFGKDGMLAPDSEWIVPAVQDNDRSHH